LYPSSIIEKNISHETLIENETLIDELNLVKDVDYHEITYDNWIYKGKGSGDTIEKILDKDEPIRTCKFITKDFMQRKNLEPKGIIPSVLDHLLSARSATKKRMKKEPDEFKKKVLDGLQLAYKVTANSVYGQLGAKTSTIFKMELAACTTSVGRERLTVDATNGVKEWAQSEGYEEPEVVYGDTDSVFVKFSRKNKEGKLLEGKEALEHCIRCGEESGEYIKKIMNSEGKQPQVLEYEKTFWPFILISKKRYTGDKYEFNAIDKKRTSMGIVLKRRDNAPIVKYVFGHVIEKIMIEKDFEATVKWLQETLKDIRAGEFSMSYFVITKSLRGYYKNPQSIAHKVLADRMSERDPGNKPKSNDRIPFAYIKVDDKPKRIGYKMKSKKVENGFYKNGKPRTKTIRVEDMNQPKYKKTTILQGDRIEHIDFIKDKKLDLDYEFYITNQIMNPVKQVLDLEMDSSETEKLFLQ
jgi:DNA polymerase elongation subunit (family B)